MLLSLIGFARVASVTPGPNNLMIAANAAAHGVRATVPMALGIMFGFGVMITLVGFGLGAALGQAPVVASGLRIGAVIWLLWLAWQIGTAPAPEAGDTRPLMGFLAAALFQWVNPKAWLLAIGANAAYIDPRTAMLPQIAVISGVFVLVAPPSMLPWVLLGRSAARLLGTGTKLRVFNIAMGLLLAASVLPLFWMP